MLGGHFEDEDSHSFIRNYRIEDGHDEIGEDSKVTCP